MSRQSMQDRLLTSLESSEVPENVEINPVTEVTTTELTEALADLAEVGSNVDNQEETVDVLVNTETSMENFLRGLNRIQDEFGALQPQAAAMYHVGLEDRLRDIPLVNKDQLFLSLEAFGGVGSADEATAASKKTLVQNLKDVWTAVVNAVQTFLKEGMAYVKDLLDVGKRMEKASHQLKAAASKIEGGKAGESISTGRHGKWLAIDGSYPSNPTHVFDVIKQSSKVASEYSAAYRQALLPVTTLVNTGILPKEKVEAAAKAVADKGFAVKPGTLDLPGGRKLVVEKDDSKLGDINTVMQAATIKVEQGKGEAPGEMPLWTKEQIVAVAGECAKLAANISEINRQYRGILEDQTAFVRKAGEIVKKSETMTEEDLAAAKQLLSKLSQIAKGAVAGIKPVVEVATQVCGANLAVGFACVKAHSAPAAAAPAAA